MSYKRLALGFIFGVCTLYMNAEASFCSQISLHFSLSVKAKYNKKVSASVLVTIFLDSFQLSAEAANLRLQKMKIIVDINANANKNHIKYSKFNFLSPFFLIDHISDFIL